MKVDYTEKGKVNIYMRECLEKILDYLLNKFKVSASTPAENHLFDVNMNCKNSSEENARFFHALVAILLF